jgi:hypothetical protein
MVRVAAGLPGRDADILRGSNLVAIFAAVGRQMARKVRFSTSVSFGTVKS